MRRTGRPREAPRGRRELPPSLRLPSQDAKERPVGAPKTILPARAVLPHPNPPEDAKELLHNAHPDWTPAGWAIRFAASLPEVMVVLSGMSDMEQLDENTAFMQDFEPLSKEDWAMALQAGEMIRHTIAIPCTGCRYCVEASKCPKGILIPNFFALYNTRQLMRRADFSPEEEYYDNLVSQGSGKASACITCKSCERVCPQHIPISEWMPKVAKVFEK